MIQTFSDKSNHLSNISLPYGETYPSIIDYNYLSGNFGKSLEECRSQFTDYLSLAEAMRNIPLAYLRPYRERSIELFYTDSRQQTCSAYSTWIQHKYRNVTIPLKVTINDNYRSKDGIGYITITSLVPFVCFAK